MLKFWSVNYIGEWIGHCGKKLNSGKAAQKSRTSYRSPAFLCRFATFYNRFLEIIAISDKVSESGAIISVRQPLQ